MPKLWQVSTGSEGRRYYDLFLRYGIMCVGGKEYRKRLKKVTPGDLVLLKHGRSKVVAAGVATERDGVTHKDEEVAWWVDVDGWHLHGLHVVEWHKPEEPLQVSGLARGTFYESHKDHLRDLAEELIDEYPAYPHEPFPPPPQSIEISELVESLVTLGLRPRNAEELTAAIERVRLLARHYHQNCDWSNVKEHETRTFLIVPLLVALGWSEQQMKIEYNVSGKSVDLVCFEQPLTKKTPDAECKIIIESKGFKSGLSYAHNQAKSYAEKLPTCERVVVSNGFCYKIFERQGDGFSEEPNAYVNLLRPTKRYPLDPDKGGAFDVFKALMP